MRILVTGGRGFLGAEVCRQLLERGYQVRSFSRTLDPQLQARGVECFQGDICDYTAVLKALDACSGVIHCAAKAGIWGKATDYYGINVTGTRNVVAACRQLQVSHLIHTSSPSVVFQGRDLCGVAEPPYAKSFLTHYPYTKMLAERLVREANGNGLRCAVLRPHLIWGLGDPHFLPRIYAKARAGRLLRVGDGTNKVDVVHVKDAARAHILALESAASGVYFVGQSSPVYLWDFIDKLLISGGLPPVKREIKFTSAYSLGAALEAAYRLFAVNAEPPMTRFLAQQLAKSHFFSHRRAAAELSYSPQVSIEAGLQDLGKS